MTFSLQTQKRIERLAQSTTNIKDHGDSGLKPDGSTKTGYHQLKDGRVIRLSSLYPQQIKEAAEKKGITLNKTPEEIQAMAANLNLRDLKNIGTYKDGTVKPGFVRLINHKVVCIKHLEVVTE